MPNSDQMAVQRHSMGVMGLLLVFLGIGLISNGASSQVIASGCLRAGLLLSVTWLAWPKLIEWRHVFPRFAVIVAMVLAIILVARPSWGKIAGIVSAVAIAVSLGGRWLSTWKHGR